MRARDKKTGRFVPLQESAAATLTPIREVGGHLAEQEGTQLARREVTIIEAGWGSSGYYSREMLARDGPSAFPVGTHMYLDHPTHTEDHERPERSVRDLAGTIATTPKMVGSELVAEANVFPVWRPVVDALAKDIGLSIRANGEISHGEAEGRSGPIVVSLDEGISVDYVTKAGAGGKVGQLIESARKMEEQTVQVGEPYGIRQREDEYCVINTDTGATVKCHDTRAKALAHQRALQINVPESLRKSLEEARNAAHWLEARIHRDFTVTADMLFADGHLSREERIALSQAIGEALQAFSKEVEGSVPELLTRDPFAEPGDNSDLEERRKEDKMSDEDRRRLSELEEKLREVEAKLEEAETEKATAIKERDDAKAAKERAEDAVNYSKAERVVREATRKEGDKEVSLYEGLPERAIDRVVTTALSEKLPLKEDGKLKTEALLERAGEAAKEEREYLTEAGSGSGAVRGMGGSNGNGDGEVSEEDLVERFKESGMSEAAAKAAVRGR